jgi:predicted N-acetyltransferase YhbS
LKVEVRAIREDEIGPCLDLWKRVWHENRPGFFERYIFGDPDYQLEYTRVAILDGGIVSAVQIVRRTISFGDTHLTMGGIANVATDQEYRGNGYAHECLQQAIQVMEADAMDFSLLFTGRPNFYSRCGYEAVAGGRLIGELRPEPLHPFTRMVVRPYEDRDDASIHLIHIAFNRERPLAVRRSAPYWRDWIAWWRGQAPALPGARATVAEHEGVVVGYCLYTIDEDHGRVRVRELGVRSGAEMAIEALLEEAADAARAHHIPSMCLPLYEDPTVEEVSDRLFVNKQVETMQSGMIRFLHRDNLLRGLAPGLTDRWQRCGAPGGRLVFTGPYGATAVSSSGSFLRVEPVEDAEGMLNQSELFDLLIGRGLPNDRLSAEPMQFANALFPANYPWFWEMDGF